MNEMFNDKYGSGINKSNAGVHIRRVEIDEGFVSYGTDKTEDKFLAKGDLVILGKYVEVIELKHKDILSDKSLSIMEGFGINIPIMTVKEIVFDKDSDGNISIDKTGSKTLKGVLTFWFNNNMDYCEAMFNSKDLLKYETFLNKRLL